MIVEKDPDKQSPNNNLTRQSPEVESPRNENESKVMSTRAIVNFYTLCLFQFCRTWILVIMYALSGTAFDYEMIVCLFVL